ncbi:MAG TPA: hypothetical protein VM582_08330 [Candidatus Thermoplasmatota archaeon]|nr:hypothetical protein [Candidatus Thermoplasmatota archaeon]
MLIWLRYGLLFGLLSAMRDRAAAADLVKANLWLLRHAAALRSRRKLMRRRGADWSRLSTISGELSRVSARAIEQPRGEEA